METVTEVGQRNAAGNRLAKAFLAGLAILACAYATETAGERPVTGIEGMVTDSSGAAIGRVRLAVRGGVDREAISDEDGRYTFEGLRNGRYLLIAEKSGFTLWQQPVDINGAWVSLEIQMLPATIRQSIKVVATADLAGESVMKLPSTLHETPRAISAFSAQELRERNFRSIPELLAVVPGMSPNSYRTGGYHFYARGYRMGPEDTRVDGFPGVNLSGGYGDRLKTAVDFARSTAPKRFAVFANLDFSNIDDPGYGKRAAAQLEADVKNGAAGLKFFKSFGMDLKDTKGERIHIDDPRFDPVFETCARLKLPVLIHTADPRQFWEPVDKYNERWYELMEIPGRRRPPGRTAPWETLIAEQHNLFRRHKKTLFINAHLGWLGGDLAQLGRLMDECPNMYTEIGAVLAELGRQPRAARAWFIKYQDRVLFGKDTWNAKEYHTYFQVLETADDYFDYYRRRHAFWQMYGLDLPDEVLQKLYYKNALRLVPGLDATAFPR